MSSHRSMQETPAALKHGFNFKYMSNSRIIGLLTYLNTWLDTSHVAQGLSFSCTLKPSQMHLHNVYNSSYKADNFVSNLCGISLQKWGKKLKASPYEDSPLLLPILPETFMELWPLRYPRECANFKKSFCSSRIALLVRQRYRLNPE